MTYPGFSDHSVAVDTANDPRLGPCASACSSGLLPSVAALLRGAPFPEDDIHLDIEVFLQQLEQGLDLRGKAASSMRAAVSRLKVSPTAIGFVTLATELQRIDAKSHSCTGRR